MISKSVETEMGNRMLTGSITAYRAFQGASWLVRPTLEQEVRNRALAGDIVLCSWARHITLTVPLSTQVYKWVPANLTLGDNSAMD